MAATLVVYSAAPAIARHADQQPTPTVGFHTADCAEAVRAAMRLVDAADARLEAARQSNQPSDMRAAMDDLRTTLGTLRSELTRCAPPDNPQPQASPAPTAAEHGAAGMDPNMPGMTHDETSQAAQPDTRDPVCHMKVDPKTAPSATHAGTTYYFCSDRDRRKFLADPAKYLHERAH